MRGAVQAQQVGAVYLLFLIKGGFMLRLFYTLILMLSLTSIGFAEDEFNSQIPQATDNPVSYPTAENSNNNTLNRTLFNYRQAALIVYNNASNITIQPGEVACNSATGNTAGQTVVYRRTTSNITANSANLDTGASFSASTTYYVYANCDAAATTFTVTISLNATTPSGVTNYRQIGTFVTDSSINITGITNSNIIGIGTATTGLGAGTVYLAQTDGMVSISAEGTASNWVANLLVDGNPSPSTRRQRCGNATASGNVCSLSYPIKAGLYYTVTTTSSTIDNYEFIPQQ